MTSPAKSPAAYIWPEIARQPALWAQAIAAINARADEVRQFSQAAGAGQLLFTGCGSAYFTGQSLAAVAMTKLGIPALAAPASEFVLFPELIFSNPAPPALIAISRSGETSETLAAVDAFKTRYPAAPVLALTAYSESGLGQRGTLTLSARFAAEEAVVQTGSITTMGLMALCCIALWSGETLDALAPMQAEAQALWDSNIKQIQALGRSAAFDRFFFLGSGMWRGMANEAMLKVKESSFCQSEAFHTMEFRHGFAANAVERSLVVAFLSERAAAQEIAVLDEMRALGACTLAIGQSPPLQVAGGWSISTNSTLPEWARLPLAMPLIHALAVERALKNGRDPDRPQGLHSYIVLPDGVG